MKMSWLLLDSWYKLKATMIRPLNDWEKWKAASSTSRYLKWAYKESSQMYRNCKETRTAKASLKKTEENSHRERERSLEKGDCFHYCFQFVVYISSFLLTSVFHLLFVATGWACTWRHSDSATQAALLAAAWDLSGVKESDVVLDSSFCATAEVLLLIVGIGETNFILSCLPGGQTQSSGGTERVSGCPVVVGRNKQGLQSLTPGKFTCWAQTTFWHLGNPGPELPDGLWQCRYSWEVPLFLRGRT